MIETITQEHKHSYWLLIFLLTLLAACTPALAEDTAGTPSTQTPAKSDQPRVDIYGAAMLDMGFEAGQSNPSWFDVVRPTKLASYKNEFGKDGNFFAGVRQSRLGVKGFIPTPLGEVKTVFEFELFGTGVDAGQTTFRLRHAYGELGHFGAGQTWSPFMDPDVFPNSVEYWGPNGMVFFRNVQFRYMPLMGNTSVTIAVERPGASGDAGQYSDRVELQNIKARFPMPDISGNVRHSGKWGHVQLAGIVRRINWDDVLVDKYDLSGHATGWGFNFSTNLKVKKDTLRASVVYGKGIENYMNDAPVDIGIENNLSNPVTPILGKTLPVLGIVAFYDRTWDDKWTTSFGYSMVDINNSNGQAANAFRRGHYGLVNLLYYPVSNFFLGPELQWGRRENFKDGWAVNDLRVQFSAKYTFKKSIGE